MTSEIYAGFGGEAVFTPPVFSKIHAKKANAWWVHRQFFINVGTILNK
jgi:hypothetical protein